MNGLSEMMESPVLMSQCYVVPVEKVAIEISASRFSIGDLTKLFYESRIAAEN